MAHLDAEIMLDGLEGRLTSTDLSQLRAHLARCGECAETFSQYGELLDAMHCDGLEDAPARSLAKAFDSFKERQASTPGVIERVATLLFDSWAQPGLAGLRASGNHSRQVALTQGEFDLHLSLDYTSLFVRGQLLRRAGGNFDSDFDVLALAEDDTEIESAIANVLGEFVFYCDPQNVGQLVIVLASGTTMRFQLPHSAGV